MFQVPLTTFHIYQGNQIHMPGVYGKKHKGVRKEVRKRNDGYGAIIFIIKTCAPITTNNLLANPRKRY